MRSLLLLAAMVAAAAAPAAAGHACAPPCGYIYPIIFVESDAEKNMVLTAPVTLNLKITYQWSFENDGTGLHDVANDIKLVYDVAKKPNWVKITFDPAEFVLAPPRFNPLLNYSYDFTGTATLTPDLSIPVGERTGDRPIIFVVSSESGMFKQSYGVEFLTFALEEGGPNATREGGDLEPAPAAEFGLGLLAVSAAFAAVAFAFRRRRR